MFTISDDRGCFFGAGVAVRDKETGMMPAPEGLLVLGNVIAESRGGRVNVAERDSGDVAREFTRDVVGNSIFGACSAWNSVRAIERSSS